MPVRHCPPTLFLANRWYVRHVRLNRSIFRARALRLTANVPNHTALASAREHQHSTKQAVLNRAYRWAVRRQDWRGRNALTSLIPSWRRSVLSLHPIPGGRKQSLSRSVLWAVFCASVIIRHKASAAFRSRLQCHTHDAAAFERPSKACRIKSQERDRR